MIRLRILTYNIYLGGSQRLEPIYTVLAQTQADVIALTEADDPHLVAALAERLSMDYVWARGSGRRHIATLSRYPIADWQIYNTPPLTQAALKTRLDIPDMPITVYNLHLLPYLLLPFEVRRWQAIGQLLNIIQAQPPGPHLIIGDLNAIAPGDKVLQHKNPRRMRWLMMLQGRLIFRLAIARLLKADYTDCFRQCRPNDDGFTWYPANPTTRYDYIFADSFLSTKLRKCTVLNNIEALADASDHMPVIAEFDL